MCSASYLKPVCNLLVGSGDAPDSIRQHLHGLAGLEVRLEGGQNKHQQSDESARRMGARGASENGRGHTSIAGYSDRERSSTDAMVDVSSMVGAQRRRGETARSTHNTRQTYAGRKKRRQGCGPGRLGTQATSELLGRSVLELPKLERRAGHAGGTAGSARALMSRGTGWSSHFCGVQPPKAELSSNWRTNYGRSSDRPAPLVPSRPARNPSRGGVHDVVLWWV